MPRRSPHDGFARITADPDRFWRRVAIGDPDDCWLWTGTRHQKGYGLVYFRREGRLTSATASRVAFALSQGLEELPARQEEVCHSCDNPPCCNPGHLWLGSGQDNQRDASRKGRRARKLDAAAVEEIMASAGRIADVAKRFGISPSMVSAIRHQKTWRHLTEGRAQTVPAHHRATKLTPDDVRFIRSSDLPASELAARFGVTRETIYLARNRRIW